MSHTITIDKAGRVVIPKPVRDALRLDPGDELELEASEDAVVLRPVRATPAMARESGVWVYRSGATVDTPLPDLIDAARSDRADELLS
jgi:AbrB family looped-hinge helix DNA binding protein